MDILSLYDTGNLQDEMVSMERYEILEEWLKRFGPQPVKVLERFPPTGVRRVY
jgi:hypothetical protein